ncbi:MAG: RsmE family RNA methyltransferase [Kofleriaceae bacterium]
MNLLLVEPSELASDLCVIADRRAAHLRDVLGIAPGVTVKMGIVGGAIGTGVVLADEAAGITLRFTRATGPAPQLDLELVLAVPRPKALARVIETCAAFAVRRIGLTNAWRVDKSYLRSPKLAAAALAHAARIGAEQGATTHLPEIQLHERLMELLDARWPAPQPRDDDDDDNDDDLPRPPAAGRLLIAHPDAKPIETVIRHGPLVLAIGPEGGWIQRELDTFVERGFTPCSLGAPILRTESAVSTALGQIVLLQRLAER